MRIFHRLRIFLLVSLMLLSLAACSNKSEPQKPYSSEEKIEAGFLPKDDVPVGDKKEETGSAEKEEEPATVKSEEEIAQELAETREKELVIIRSVNVLENVQLKKAEDVSIKKNYETVPLESMEESMAWQTTTGGDSHETYIFIGKLAEDADVNAIASELMNATAKLPGTKMDGSIQCAYTNGYIIMASAPNASDILNKFSAAMTLQDLNGVEDIFFALSEDIGKADGGDVIIDETTIPSENNARET